MALSCTRISAGKVLWRWRSGSWTSLGRTAEVDSVWLGACVLGFYVDKSCLIFKRNATAQTIDRHKVEFLRTRFQPTTMCQMLKVLISNPPVQEKDLRLRETWFKAFQANDNAKEALTALLDDDWGSSHVFNGLIETLAADEQERIACFRPPKKARKEVASSCFDAQRHYLQSFQPGIFGRRVANNCARHPGSECPLYFPVVRGEYRGDALPPLLVGFAGFMCTPWSPQGPQLGSADPSMESYNFWKLKMVNSPLDMVYAENSPRFPFKGFQETMEGSGKWKCFYVIFGPEDRFRLRLCNTRCLSFPDFPNSREIWKNVFSKF